MKLKEWRKIERYSQYSLADALLEFVRKKFPKERHTLLQRTVCAWENGRIPKKFWIDVLKEFTQEKVTILDFYNA